MLFHRAALAAGAFFVLSAGAVSAVPIVGTLNFTGAVRVSNTAIDFLPPAGGPDGQFNINGPLVQDGSFVPLANTTGRILDLDRAQYPVGSITPALQGFLTFTVAPNYRFDLTQILAGTFSSAQCFQAPAAGQQCTPPPAGALGASPFNLSNQTSTSSVASFQVLGTFVNTATGETTPGVGIFSTQFVSQPYQAVLQTLSTNGFVEASFSAEFTSVPEPSAWILGAMGLALMGVRRIRRT